MFFFQFEATPDPSHGEAAELGGAFINCWVACAGSEADAEAIVRERMAEECWCPFERIESSIVDLSDYDDEHPGFGHYHRALVDGCAMMVHTYPIDEGSVAGDAEQHADVGERPHRGRR